MGEEVVFDRIDLDLFVAVSMGASANSPAIAIQGMGGWSARCSFTGSPVGTFKAQASCNATGKMPTTDAEWTDVANSSQDISAAGDVMWNYADAQYNWLRIVYTRASGSGTLNGRVNAKGAA